MPGSHIPIRSPDRIEADSVDFVLILPWNIVDEVTDQLSSQGLIDKDFVTAIPKLEILKKVKRNEK